MQKIKTVGVIGLGTIGISMAYILQESGLNIIGYKHKNRQSDLYKDYIKKEKIIVVNNTNNTFFKKKAPLKISITNSLQEIAEKSDLILNCCRFPQNSSIYQFSEFEKHILRKKNTPILIVPGNLGATWLVGNKNTNVGLVAYAPVFATSKTSPEGVIVHLLDFKSKIPLAHNNLEIRENLVGFFNEQFKFREEAFVDGGNVLKTALSSPVLSINAAAICDNSQALIHSNGKPIMKDIYVLSETYSELFQELFNEQKMVAKALGIDNIRSLKNWLSNRVISIKPNTSVTEMLASIYKGKLVNISGKDRRITESFYALLFFINFANTLGCMVPVAEELFQQINELNKKLNNKNFSIHNYLSIKKSAQLYAYHALSVVKKNENTVDYASVYENGC